jgi:protocatechuate 3,4-dioxygenase beta subunit
MKKLFISAICVLVLSAFVFGQSQVGKIVGTVTDTDGNALPGVLVKATSPKLVGEATSVTDENGVYRLLNLVPGTYTIAFSMEGFKTVEQCR